MSTAAPGVLSVLWANYLSSLKERPLPTKIGTSLTIYAASKLIATALSQDKKVDAVALVKHASFSFVSVPMMHYYYGWIDKLFTGQEGAWVILVQLLIDQALFSPFFYVVYYIYMGLVNNKLGDVHRQITKELIPVGLLLHLHPHLFIATFLLLLTLPETSIDSAKFWTVVQFINFKFVPTELRILFGNVCNLLWSVYWLLQMDNNAKKEDQKKKK